MTISDQDAVHTLLQCPACLESYSESRPIHSCAAGHMTCGDCREKMPEKTGCFECRDPNVKPNAIMMQFLGHMKKQCAACKEHLPLLQLEHHENFECPKKEVECSLCSMKVARGQMTQHYKEKHHLIEYKATEDLGKSVTCTGVGRLIGKALRDISRGHQPAICSISISFHGIICILQIRYAAAKKTTPQNEGLVEVRRFFQKQMKLPSPLPDPRLCLRVSLGTPKYPYNSFHVPVIPIDVDGKIDYMPWGQVCLLEVAENVPAFFHVRSAISPPRSLFGATVHQQGIQAPETGSTGNSP